MQDLATLAIITPVIVGIVEAGKRAGMPSPFAPLIAIVLGAGLGVLLIDPRYSIAGALWGVIAGLTAVGLYSGSRSMVETVRGEDGH